MKTSDLRTAALLLVLLLIPAAAAAQTGPHRWRERAEEYVKGKPWTFAGALSTTRHEKLIGAGRLGVRDRFVSPIAHTGLDLRVLLGADYPSFASRWHLRSELELAVALAKNRANGSAMYVPQLYGMIAPVYAFPDLGGLRLEMAPACSLELQGDVKLSNTNNIANLKASAGLDAWGRLSYRVPWEVLPLRLSYSLALPLLHAAYHPDYGQSYYEYISGDTRTPVRISLTTPYNRHGLRQRVLAELPIHSLTLLLGAQYVGTREQLHHTLYEQGGWAVLVGITFDSAAFSGGRALRSEQIASSY